MPRNKHPPKKKHANRPRPPAPVPLSAEERAERAKEEFGKAITFLKEAELVAAQGGAPHLVVHGAYFAMEHAARAALFAAGGVGKYLDVPKSHEHVNEHYGKLVAGLGEPLESTGRSLNRALTDRTIADYNLTTRATQASASELVRAARAMVDAIQTRWGFKPRSGPRSPS